MNQQEHPTIFLLSPASVAGIRAQQLISPRASFAAALAYRSEGGVAIEEAFSFMSALYFRGKVAYVRRFASGNDSIRVIAPGFGLVPFGWALTTTTMKRLQKVPVDVKSRAYRLPLQHDARALAETLPPAARVILLGSVATGKYLDVLAPIFGERLAYPSAFAGLGDMSRGAIMLRAAASGEELEYEPLTSRQHRRL